MSRFRVYLYQIRRIWNLYIWLPVMFHVKHWRRVFRSPSQIITIRPQALSETRKNLQPAWKQPGLWVFLSGAFLSLSAYTLPEPWNLFISLSWIASILTVTGYLYRKTHPANPTIRKVLVAEKWYPYYLFMATAFTGTLILGIRIYTEQKTWNYKLSAFPEQITTGFFHVFSYPRHLHDHCIFTASISIDSPNIVVYSWVTLSSRSLCAQLKPGVSFHAKFFVIPVSPEGTYWQKIFYWLLRTRSISHRVFLSPTLAKSVQVLDTTCQSFQHWISHHSIYLRQQFLQTVQSCFPDTFTTGILSAMLLGAKEYLPESLEQTFRTTGLAHLFAVSGLHVGFVYGLALFFTQILPFSWVRYLFQIITIWAFIFLTGLPPSGIRAGIFLTFWILRNFLHKDLSSFHILGLAGYTILLIHPGFLFHVGFLLSFFAVAGIFMWFPFWQNLIILREPILRFLWQISGLTLAVQIYLLGILIGFFGHISLHSVLSNLAGIPLATILFYLSLPVLGILSWTPLQIQSDSLILSLWIDMVQALTRAIIKTASTLEIHASGLSWHILPPGPVFSILWLTGMIFLWIAIVYTFRGFRHAIAGTGVLMLISACGLLYYQQNPLFRNPPYHYVIRTFVHRSTHTFHMLIASPPQDSTIWLCFSKDSTSQGCQQFTWYTRIHTLKGYFLSLEHKFFQIQPPQVYFYRIQRRKSIPILLSLTSRSIHLYPVHPWYRKDWKKIIPLPPFSKTHSDSIDSIDSTALPVVCTCQQDSHTLSQMLLWMDNAYMPRTWLQTLQEYTKSNTHSPPLFLLPRWLPKRYRTFLEKSFQKFVLAKKNQKQPVTHIHIPGGSYRPLVFNCTVPEHPMHTQERNRTKNQVYP